MSATRLSILLAETIGTIAPELHGQFAEHLGELVYPGIWVGPDSSVPNVDGIRTDVVEALKPLNIPVLRWPGGCFADDYHWRDGIGPREDRPQRLNTHWDMAPEPNAFGTHEFMAFSKALDTTPYFAANLGSATPQEMRDWIEYCNHPGGTTLSDERRANGAEEPFGIEWWGIGNELWGCGGTMSPEFYAEEYSRFRTFAPDFGGTPISPVACGPNGNDWAWTRRFFEQLDRGSWTPRIPQMRNFAAHYYCRTAGTATEYTELQWLELLTRAVGIEGVIVGHRSLMDDFDPERKIGLILDEWGTWHPVEEGHAPRSLYQQNTMRDACVAGLSLDIFHNHADKLVMANIAQLINVLQSLLLANETQCIKTPTYHVFDLYAEHKGGRAVRLINASDVISNGEAAEDLARQCFMDNRRAELRAVSGSASVKQDQLCLTLVNSSPTDDLDIEVDLRGGTLQEASMISLVGQDIHDHNTFDQPNAVTPGESQEAKVVEGILRLTLPAASVSRVLGRLG